MALLIHATTQDGKGFTLEPSEEIPIRIDLSRVENGEVGSTFGDLSQQFTILGTEEHNAFFNHAYEIGGEVAPGFARTVSVVVEDEGEDLFTGNMTLDDINIDEEGEISYNVSLQSDLISLNDALAGKLLRDADWSSIAHDYTIENVINSQDAINSPVGRDVFYPMLNIGYDESDIERIPQGEDVTAISPYFGEVARGDGPGTIFNEFTPMRVQQFIPAFRVGYVIDRIFELAGRSYESQFIENNLANAYILPKHTEGNGIILEEVADDYGFIANEDNTSTFQVNPFNNGQIVSNTDNFNTLEYTYGVNELIYPDTGRDAYSNGVYTIPVSGTYEFEFVGDLDLDSEDARGSEFADIEVRIITNDPRVDNSVFKLPRLSSTGFEDKDYTWSFTLRRYFYSWIYC